MIETIINKLLKQARVNDSFKLQTIRIVSELFAIVICRLMIVAKCNAPFPLSLILGRVLAGDDSEVLRGRNSLNDAFLVTELPVVTWLNLGL